MKQLQKLSGELLSGYSLEETRAPVFQDTHDDEDLS
jgi:hypothetical protein